MPGRTPAAAGDADTGVGTPPNSMRHARKALSVSRWRDHATGIRALYRIKANGPGVSYEEHFAVAGTDWKLCPPGYGLKSVVAKRFSGLDFSKPSVVRL
jgi:hypothetical protein